MSLPDFKTRLLAGEKFTRKQTIDKQNPHPYCHTNFFMLGDGGHQSTHLLKSPSGNKYNEIDKKFFYHFDIHSVKEDHLVIKVPGVGSTFLETIPFSKLIFLKDIPAQLAETKNQPGQAA